MKIEDITLNKKNLSQPSPVSGWARVVGQDKISITNLQTKMKHTVENTSKQVFANLPVIKGNQIQVEGNLLYGRFFAVEVENEIEEA